MVKTSESTRYIVLKMQFLVQPMLASNPQWSDIILLSVGVTSILPSFEATFSGGEHFIVIC